MITLIQQADLFIFSLFQRFSDWLTKMTGIGRINYKLGHILLGLFVSLTVFTGLMNQLKWYDIVLIPVSITMWFFVRYLAMEKEQSESEELSETRVISSEHFRPVYVISRLLFICVTFKHLLSVILILVISGLTFFPVDLVFRGAANLFIVSSLYFFVCHPLPPRRGHVHEWLSRFGRKPVPVSVRSDS